MIFRLVAKGHKMYHILSPGDGRKDYESHEYAVFWNGMKCTYLCAYPIRNGIGKEVVSLKLSNGIHRK